MVYKHLLAVRDALTEDLVRTPRRPKCRRWVILRIVESSKCLVDSDVYLSGDCLTGSEGKAI